MNTDKLKVCFYLPIFLLTAVLVTIISSFFLGCEVDSIPASQLSSKLVWAHNLKDLTLEMKSVNTSLYGAHYPLALSKESWTTIDRAMVATAKKAGIDGFAVDIANNPSKAISLLEAADYETGLMVAPTLDVGGSGVTAQNYEDTIVQAVSDYCKVAASHSSAAREGEAFIVFTYSQTGVPPSSWENARKRIKDAGYKVLWVGDISVNFNGNPSVDNVKQQLLPYMPTYDVGYIFNCLTNAAYWNAITTEFTKAGSPFAGGICPSYYRGWSGKAIYPFGFDSNGTALLRNQWERQIKNNLPWTHITTWNDYVEHTNIDPDSDWNMTRFDITAWYAARFKGQPEPFKEPRLYITTPQALYRNETSVAEALVLNPSDHTVTVSIQLLDGKGKTFGGRVSASVAPHSQGAAVLPLTSSGSPNRRFLRARAKLSDSVQQSVVSAPIIFYDAGFRTPYNNYNNNNNRPVLYYSVPATHALPGKVNLSIKDMNAEVNPPNGTNIRFVDVLHDTNLVHTFVETQASYSTSLGPEVHESDDNHFDYVSGSDYGIYVARVIDSQNRVGYSNPIYAK